jgi:carbohydrate-selective porin OprB
LPQWAAPKGGPAVIDFVWTPYLVWRPFTDTGFGSGAVTYYAQQNQYWSGTDTPRMQKRLGLLTPPSDWFGNTTDYAQLTYTQTLPGGWRFLSLTVGQYGFGLYDGNRYAGDAQTGFVNYALAQNATQTYGSAGLGAYLEAAAPARGLVLAGGFQDATNLSGATLTAPGLTEGKLGWFCAARWTPDFLAGGTYGLIYYAEPDLPADELPASHGISFSAEQNFDARWGLFLRANMATEASSTIASSLAWGVVRRDPWHRDPLDQAGLGIARNRTNFAAVDAPARPAEWVAEAYYDYTVFKGLQLAPDLQLYFAPAQSPASRPVAVLTLRATASF